MAKNIQRTYSSIRDYKKRTIKNEGSDDFDKLKNGQSDFSDCRRTKTTDNWSRETYKSEQPGTKRVGSQSPLKLAREHCKRKRTLDVAGRKKLDVYDFSTTEDDGSDSNSCPPNLSAPSALSSSGEETDAVLSSSQPSFLRKTSKNRNSKIKYDLTSINHNLPPLKPSPNQATSSSTTKSLHSTQKPVNSTPSASVPPKLVKASSWPKSQPTPKQKETPVVKKDKVEVITIANVKQAYQCKEHGERQQFIDEMKYIMSNLNKSRSEMIRCLSCCNLASHCLKAEFRQRFRARSLTSRVLQALKDAPGQKTLALCTATLIFVLTKDQMNGDFDRNSLELITNLMKADELDDEELSGKAHKDYCRIVGKVKAILSQVEEWFGSKLGKEASEMHQKETVGVTELLLSSLLNLMSLRDGQTFKGQLRLLGTLDHVASLVVNNFKLLRPSPYPKSRPPPNASDPEVILDGVMKPLAVLESASYMSKDNQSYLVVYDGSVLVTALTELLCYCQKPLSAGAASNEIAIKSLLATLKVLVNITHDNELGSQRVGEQNNIIDNICRCVLVLPASLEGEKQFDILVMGLGLLINLVECVADNRQALEELRMEVNGNHTNVLSHLVNVFLLHYTAAEQSNINLPMPKSMAISSSSEAVKSGGGRQRVTSNTTEMLDTISKKLLEGNAVSGNHEELSGLEWLEDDAVIGEDAMPTDNGVCSRGQRNSSSDRESEENMEDSFVISREELNTAILQAGKQMEHSFISAYCSLVLGVMCRYSENCRELIVSGMPSRSFKEMINILQQFVNFSDMVNSVSQSGIESVRKIILYLKEFDKDCK